MQALYSVSSGYAEGFLKASQRLQRLTHESWTIDWQKLQLTCPHGVSIPIAQVQGEGRDTVEPLVADRHKAAARSHAKRARSPAGHGLLYRITHPK